MNKQDPTCGILTDDYASQRTKKKELIFRYKVRARMAAWALTRFCCKKDNHSIIDFGAADGRTLIEIDTLVPNAKFLGIEYSQSLLDQTTALPENIRMIHGDISNLPHEIKSSSADMITALAVLEHLPDPLKAVKEAHRILNPNGIIVVTCPDPFWDQISTKFSLLDNTSHETHPGKKDLLRLMEEGGLTTIHYQKFMWAPIAFLPYLSIPVNPTAALSADLFINSLRIFNGLFVNQCIVAQKTCI